MALPDFARVLHTYDVVSAPLGRWLSDQVRDELGMRLKVKAEQSRPTIMVYGIYNAGKSTLLNALMGRVEAKMADRPATSTVTEYPWGIYTLLDTPGIDAPMEHEAVAQEQLLNSEVVLFVVSASGAIDESNTWERLVDIVASERRVMLIVNNKAGITMGGRDHEGINGNLRMHLQNAASRRGIKDIVNKVPVHWVNAKSALRARLESKQALLAASGMLELEDALGEFLEQSDTGSIFATCCKDLQSAIEQATLRLAQASDNRQVEALAKARLQINNERVRLTSSLNDHLDRDCRSAKLAIVDLISDVAEGRLQGNQAMEEGATLVVQRMGDALKRTLEVELPKTQQSLSDIGERLAESTVEYANAMLQSNVESGKKDDDSGLSPAIKEALKKVPVGNIKEMTEQGVKAALELGKEFLPNLFKGIGPKTMGRWASTAGRWAGPLMQVGVALYDIYRAVSTENAEKAAQERRTKAIDDCASTFVHDLRQAYQQQIYLVVEQVFVPMDGWIAGQREALEEGNRVVREDRLAFEQALIALRRDDCR
ncbi:50S ribosome-binding GTPase [Pseudomonas sp. LM20]|uniref:GTPase n=1 Tax=Pseudomonas sp. LM20 TaxID=2899116 RepID=UPI001F4564E7|nr:GTPase [Pseudomonas sp. LM20]MCE5989548.1 50S ribosome-binding GTPase [Pseudomonas sp. LM20]